MDYQKAFAIGASGMAVEKLRLDVTAANFANAHSAHRPDDGVAGPLRVVARAVLFEAALGRAGAAAGGARVVGVVASDLPPRLVHEPGHPSADARGFVAYPGIDPVAEMVNLISTLRAYEANVATVNVAKTMALRALEIGGNA